MTSNSVPGFESSVDLATLLTTPLERGKACAECRRKKQKCDGLRPSCWSCIRTNRPCSYERQPNRPVSVLLQERIGELETKLESLTRGQQATPSTPISSLFQPSGPVRAVTGMAGTVGAIGPSQYTTSETHVPEEIMAGLKWWEDKVIPAAVHDYLFKTFVTHCWRVHFYFNQAAFESRMASSDLATQPHPCYLHGIYLMACYFTSLGIAPSSSLGEHEEIFLARAQRSLTESLAMSDRLMDFVRGSSLITIYFLMRGRYLEGYHVHCGTARFALSCGLHRIGSNDLQETRDPHPRSNIGCLLPPPPTKVELGDRLNAFWQIYWCDKLLSPLTGFVAALPGQGEEPDSISTVFPMEIEYYQSERQASRNDTILDLLSPSISHHEVAEEQNDSSFTMVLKALTLLEQANRIGQIHRIKASDNSLSALKALHIATDRFAATIPAVLGPTKRDEEDPDSDPPSIAVLMARTITLGALLEMNNTTAATDTQAYNARLTSAGYIASLVFYLGPENFANADMATGYCWCLAAQVLLEHMHNIRTRLQTAQEPPPVSSSVPVMQSSNDEMSNSLIECESQLTRLLAALEKLSTVFPTLVHQVQITRQVMGNVATGPLEGRE